MKHILFIILILTFTANILFAQTDTLFKNKEAPSAFMKLKYDEIKKQYSWNDTSVRIIDYFRKENSSSHFNLGASIGLVVLGPILILISFEQYNYHLLVDPKYMLLNVVGFSVGGGGVIGLPISLIEAKIYNKSNLYKILRTYLLQGKIKKKYCEQIKND